MWEKETTEGIYRKKVKTEAQETVAAQKFIQSWAESC